MKYLIHTEKVWDEKVWLNLLNFIEKNKNKCSLFLMPPQYEYQYAVLGYRGTKRLLKEKLSQKYQKLEKLRQKYHFKVGMHLHLSLFPEEIKQKEKEKIFQEGYSFLKEFFPKIPIIVFGWFKYDNHMKKLCNYYKINIQHKGLSFHDYDLPLTKKSLIEEWCRDKFRKILSWY